MSNTKQSSTRRSKTPSAANPVRFAPWDSKQEPKAPRDETRCQRTHCGTPGGAEVYFKNQCFDCFFYGEPKHRLT